MKPIGYWLAICLFSTAAAAEPVTYDFQGIVGQGKGIYSSVAAGSVITGTYTIDYANAISAQSQGVIGDPENTWVAEAHGGAAYSLPVVSDYVFSSTAQVDGFSYVTGAPGAEISRSYIQGSSAQLSAYESELNYSPASGDYGSDSGFVISNSNGAFTTNGFPVFTGAYGAAGYFELVGHGQVSYQITSLAIAPVPLPAAGWLLLGGFGSIALIRTRRRQCP